MNSGFLLKTSDSNNKVENLHSPNRLARNSHYLDFRQIFYATA